MNDDKKAINERKAAMNAHAWDCAICRSLMAIRMGHPSPYSFRKESELIAANREHLQEVGMIPSDAVMAEMKRVLEGFVGSQELGRRLLIVDELPQGAYARYSREDGVMAEPGLLHCVGNAEASEKASVGSNPANTAI